MPANIPHGTPVARVIFRFQQGYSQHANPLVTRRLLSYGEGTSLSGRLLDIKAAVSRTPGLDLGGGPNASGHAIGNAFHGS